MLNCFHITQTDFWICLSHSEKGIPRSFAAFTAASISANSAEPEGSKAAAAAPAAPAAQ